MSASSGKRGRPPVAPDKAKGVIFSVRVTDRERGLFIIAAALTGKSASAWARELLLKNVPERAVEIVDGTK